MTKLNLFILVNLSILSLSTLSAEAMISERDVSTSVKVKRKLTFEDGCKISLFENSESVRIKESNEDLIFEGTDKPAFKNDHGEVVVEYSGLVTDKVETRSWAKATFQPKGFSAAHHHKERTEDYYITGGEKGTARIVLNGINHDLSTGDHIRIYPNDVHQVINLSENTPVELIVKCFPSWVFTDVHFESH